MTVENTQNKMPPLQMGTATEYPFTFAVLLQDPTEEEALEAIKASVLLADGTEIELEYGTDYTVTLNTDRIGGTLTVNNIRTASDYLTIYRQYEQTQEVDYKDFNSAPAETFEQCFDKLTMLSQQQQEEINRSLKLNVSSTTVNPTLPEPIANNTLIWDSEGASLKNYDIIGENNQFKAEVNSAIATGQAEIQAQFDAFENMIDTEIEDVREAATKINELEQAVEDAQTSASNAQTSAESATQAATSATQAAQQTQADIQEIEDIVEELSNRVSFNLFDTKISDHVLEGNEAKGWALQGTYVSGALYPDFYNKCLEEKNTATATETTLGDSVLTMYIHPNGHQFYNIADKTIVDTFYETYGIADFYGIDEENERIFLPRNKYFHQLTGNVSKVNEMVEAGLPNIEGVSKHSYNDYGGAVQTGAFYPNANPASALNLNGGTTGGQFRTLGFNASLSNPIYGNSNTVQPPSSLKLLYYCVGNTEVTQAITNVTEVTTSENDTIPLFSGMYFDFKPNNVSWLKAGEQQNNAGIYKTCYDTLVEIVNGVNNYDLKVINQADMQADVNYDKYWKLDQDNLTFRTPLTIGTENRIDWNSSQTITQLPFTAPYDCYAFIHANRADNNGNLGYISINGKKTLPFTNVQGYMVGDTTTQILLNKGDIVTVEGNSVFKSGYYCKLKTNNQLYFKVANAVQNLELLDAGEVLEGLANKLDIGHKQEIISWGIPDYENAITVDWKPSNPFIAPSAGVIRFNSSRRNGGWYKLLVNGKSVSYTDNANAGYVTDTPLIPVAKGDRITEEYSGDAATLDKKFYPLKGAN